VLRELQEARDAAAEAAETPSDEDAAEQGPNS